MIKEKSEYLSFCGNYVRKADPDRFFCALFMPAALREHYFRLLAFYTEITRAVALSSSWSVAGPMAGYIRLQWWRDLLLGKEGRDHELAPFIQDSLASGFLKVDELLQIIDAREEELDGIKDWYHWDELMQKSAGQIQKIMARLFKIMDPDLRKAVSCLGIAYETVYIAHHLPFILKTGRCFLPEMLVKNYNLSRSEDGIMISDSVLQEIRVLLKNKAFSYLQDCPSVSFLGRNQVSLILPIIFTQRDLKRFDQWGFISHKRGLGDQWAVLQVYLRGKFKFKHYND